MGVPTTSSPIQTPTLPILLVLVLATLHVAPVSSSLILVTLATLPHLDVLQVMVTYTTPSAWSTRVRTPSTTVTKSVTGIMRTRWLSVSFRFPVPLLSLYLSKLTKCRRCNRQEVSRSPLNHLLWRRQLHASRLGNQQRMAKLHHSRWRTRRARQTRSCCQRPPCDLHLGHL